MKTIQIKKYGIRHTSPTFCNAGGVSVKILNQYFYRLLDIANDYVPKHIDEYDYRLIYNEDNFLFNGDVWFNSYDTSMKNLRIELLTLYLNELKNDRLA